MTKSFGERRDSLLRINTLVKDSRVSFQSISRSQITELVISFIFFSLKCSFPIYCSSIRLELENNGIITRGKIFSSEAIQISQVRPINARDPPRT